MKAFDWFIKIVATAALGAGVAWGSYLTTELDKNKERDAQQQIQIDVDAERFIYIRESLLRIETGNKDVMKTLAQMDPEVKVYVPKK